MSNSKAPQFPLSGGDYIHDASGLKQVGKSTAPPVPKSQAKADLARASQAKAEPATTQGKPDAGKPA